ncbi:uncharacterized protein LOC122669303 [Telopea speciosissima]|uniref:uncharacterized protein LOC122669303 n=1 Tax=Telopea speciosissima TaxID=54955 RepID=UPI001CC62055|nr:uncharacterized protein LOC122669303 [Telopea speciosissima]
MVYPSLLGDNQTRFFLYWTDDGYEQTGCYNLQCPGFVQTNKNIYLGSIIKPVSIYNAEQFDITIAIVKDKVSGNWWIQLQNELLGYWPDSILTGLAGGASMVHWGGEITNSHSDGFHTTTQMGSGHFPSEGYAKSSYFRNLRVVDSSTNIMANPKGITPFAAKPQCYDVHINENTGSSYGYHFYYGGPGLSQNCR